MRAPPTGRLVRTARLLSLPAGAIALSVEVDKLLDYLAPFTTPAAHETFRFSRDWLRSQFARVNDPRNPEFGVALQLTLPAEHLFTHRVWLGCVGVLSQLGAEVPVRSELLQWLPGYEPLAGFG